MRTDDVAPPTGADTDLLRRLLARHADACRAFPFLETRLRRHLPDVRRGYRALYHDADESRLLRLFDALVEGLHEREADLHERDRRREADPAWFQAPAMVGMMCYVDRFADDLASLIEKIPYLEELGVSYLHLMPLMKPRQGPNDGGYAVADYRAVDPRLGTIDQLRALARRLHAAGIHLVVDFVMNHTAREHAWAQAALAGDARFQAFYLTFENRALPDAYERTLPEVFPDFAPGNFTYQPAIDRWVWTTFYDFQWDLNYANPDVFECIFREMLFLANVGADVLRLDAVPFVWKRMGTNCQNQPEILDLLSAFRALMRIAAPGVLFKAEAIVAPDDIVRYLGVGGYEGKACDLAYHATLMNHLWHALACENTHLLRTTLSTLPAAPRETTWINYVRCHDDIGWGIADANAEAVGQHGRDTRMFCTDFYTGALPHSYAEGYRFQVDEGTGEARVSGTAAALAGLQRALVEADPEAVDRAVRRLLLLHGVVYFMKGIPLLYSGDEIGQLNDFSYLNDPLKAGDNRWIHRPQMDWQKAAWRHTPGRVEHRLFDGIRRLARVRSAQQALHGRSEDRIILADNDHLFLAERAYGGERLLLAANFSHAWQAAALPALPPPWHEGTGHDVLADARLHFASGYLAVPPYGLYWLAPAPPSEHASPVQVVAWPPESYTGKT